MDFVSNPGPQASALVSTYCESKVSFPDVRIRRNVWDRRIHSMRGSPTAGRRRCRALPPLGAPRQPLFERLGSSNMLFERMGYEQLAGLSLGRYHPKTPVPRFAQSSTYYRSCSRSILRYSRTVGMVQWASKQWRKQRRIGRIMRCRRGPNVCKHPWSGRAFEGYHENSWRPTLWKIQRAKNGPLQTSIQTLFARSRIVRGETDEQRSPTHPVMGARLNYTWHVDTDTRIVQSSCYP